MGDNEFITKDEAMLLLAQVKEEVMAEVYKDRGDIKVNSSGITELRATVKEIKVMIQSQSTYAKVQMGSGIITLGAVILAIVLS